VQPGRFCRGLDAGDGFVLPQRSEQRQRRAESALWPLHRCVPAPPGDAFIIENKNDVLAGVMVVLSLSLLTPYFYFIPRATLAAVIMCAVVFMVEVDKIAPMWRTNS
jgi:Sulfate permease family